jgi:GTP pyrophosphokinase
MIRIDDLIARVSAYAPAGADLGIISKAYVYSARLHRDRFSSAGTPVLQHALEVAGLLADFRLDIPCIVAGLLHDVLEEGLAEPAAIREMVGEDVAGLVVELSRLSRASFRGSAAARAEHMRQMILASTRDLRVILILLADQLQRLRVAATVSEEERIAVAHETLAIYGPIAHRLGIHFFKAELEDRAFHILKPGDYQQLQKTVEKRVSERIAAIEQMKRELTDLMEIHGLRGEVLGRTKNLYSIHAKMQRDKVELDRIYDLLAARIIVERKEDCYKMLGLIHAAYSPLPGKFKDYIALPKPNGYQSLHTCVFGATGDIIEIQIRDQEMHRQAELGIAAHFIYKDGALADERELADAGWFRRLLENLANGQDPQKSIDLLTQELESDQVFVFTPAGEVIKLAKGATPIDFAYAIHTDVGHRCAGAKMNGRMISIRTPLENGGVVEIITNARQVPNEDWLNYAVSSKALARIRSFLRASERNEAIAKGKDRAVREVRRLVKKPEELLKLEPVREWMNRNSLASLDDLYAAVGAERINLKEALYKLFPEPGKEAEAPKPEPLPLPRRKARKKRTAKQLVSVAGLDNLMVRFAKCCSPVYGDAIKGIITRGRGVSVHHPGCHNLTEQMYSEGRVVDAEWVEDFRELRPVGLAVRATTSMKDLIALVERLEEESIAPITPGRITSRKGVYTQHLTLMVGDSRQLDKLISRLNARKGISAERVRESA